MHPDIVFIDHGVVALAIDHEVGQIAIGLLYPPLVEIGHQSAQGLDQSGMVSAAGSSVSQFLCQRPISRKEACCETETALLAKPA